MNKYVTVDSTSNDCEIQFRKWLFHQYVVRKRARDGLHQLEERRRTARLHTMLLLGPPVFWVALGPVTCLTQR